MCNTTAPSAQPRCAATQRTATASTATLRPPVDATSVVHLLRTSHGYQEVTRHLESCRFLRVVASLSVSWPPHAHSHDPRSPPTTLVWFRLPLIYVSFISDCMHTKEAVRSFFWHGMPPDRRPWLVVCTRKSTYAGLELESIFGCMRRYVLNFRLQLILYHFIYKSVKMWPSLWAFKTFSNWYES